MLALCLFPEDFKNRIKTWPKRLQIQKGDATKENRMTVSEAFPLIFSLESPSFCRNPASDGKHNLTVIRKTVSCALLPFGHQCQGKTVEKQKEEAI